MDDSAILTTVRTKYELLRPLMDERMRRQWAASEALSLKRGGVTVVAKATGLSRTTIGEGMRELRERTNLGIEDESCVWELPTRVRRPGGGRHPLKDERSHLGAGPGSPDRTDHPWGPAVAVAVDLQEHPEPRRGVVPARASGQLPDRGPPAARPGLQPPGPSQDPAERFPSRSGRPVPAHQPAGDRLPGAGTAGGVGGHEEEGVGRGFQDPRAGNGSRRGGPRRPASMTSRTSDSAR